MRDMVGQESDAARAFFELTPEKVLAAVERLGVSCTGRILALNSMENRVYEVELDVDLAPKAAKWEAFRVIKLYRPGRWTREQILEEHEFLCEAAKADLPVVVPLRFNSGLTLETLPDSSIHYAVFPKVGGRILDELSEDELEQIGRLIARLHSVGATHPFKHRLALTVKSYGYDNLNYLREHKLIPPTVEAHFLRIAERIFDTCDPWFKDVTQIRIHGDCHLGNILWLWSKCSVVDFDDALMGPAVQDLWLLTPGRDDDSLRRQAALVRGYASMRPFDHGSLRLREPLRALRMVHFTTWIAKRFEDPAFKQVFVDYGSERYWREQLVALQDVGECLGIA
ncbi:MAG: serine/threonine protein kinase [Pseudomonadota bacterium]